MSIEAVFYVQVASIVAFLVSLFVLYRLLVSSKDATIETLKQQVSFMEGRAKAAVEDAPDVLLLRREKRVDILTKELEAAAKYLEAEKKGKEPLLSELEELKQIISTGGAGVSGPLLANQVVARRSSIENELRRALVKGEFILDYQPQLSLETRAITGVEALLRWNKPDSGLVMPAYYIPILEESGLIIEVERWVLRKAAEVYLSWHRRGLTAVRIAINVSAMQMRSSSFISEVEQIIATDERLKSGLELEVTESALMEGFENVTASLLELRAIGVRIAIDDFGTGYSSLSNLNRLPLDRLKIDRSFVQEIKFDHDSRAIVSAIIDLAHSLNLNVIAEGVETEEQSRILRSMNCDEIQGNVIDRPLPIHLFENRYLTPEYPDR